MPSRARNKLSVRQVAAITAPGIYSDGGGLYLRVRQSGRSWFFIGTLKDQLRPKKKKADDEQLGNDEKKVNASPLTAPKTAKKIGGSKSDGSEEENEEYERVSVRIELGLGSALDVSLARARERAAEIRTMLLDGKNPVEERAKAKAKKVPVITFGKFAEELLDDIEDGFRNRKHRDQWRSTLTGHAKALSSVPINEVTTEQILAVLQPIWLSKHETASRLRGRIERVLDAAKVKGLRSGENPARGRGHLDLLLPKWSKANVKHHPALPFAEVGKFMADLGQRPAVAARALEFAILTAARSGEVRGMTWAEVDLDARLWRVPADRMKAGFTHEVPLSDAALAVLQAVPAEGRKPADYVFPAPRGGALSDMSLSQLLKRMGRTGITVHGFRSTFRDWAGETTEFGREEVEMALAHTVASSVERAYRRGRALEKRRELMADWAKYCGYSDEAKIERESA